MFFSAIRQNDLETLNKMLENDFPLDWAQTFAETSLPEYAMKHGAVEAAWWLMSQNVMPESWAAFSGDTWKSFLNRGWNLVVSKEGPSIPMDAYKEIIKSGMKKTGGVFPSWLEQTLSSSVKNIGSVAGSIFARASRAAADYLDSLDKKVDREQALRQNVEKDEATAFPKESPAPTVSQNKPAKKTVKKATKKAIKKEVSPSSPPPSKKPKRG